MKLIKMELEKNCRKNKVGFNMEKNKKMIKEGIYNECNSDIYNSFIGKLIKRYRLMKTRDKKIKFIISIFNECKKEINFDF